MRNKGRIIALLAVVVVLFGALFLLTRVLPDKTETAQVTPPPEDPVNQIDIVPFSQVDMVKIVMETPDGTLTMNKVTRKQTLRTQNEDGSITSEINDIQVWESPDMDMDEDVANRLAFNGSFYSTIRRVVEKASAEDMKAFGFENLWKLTFSTADKSAVLIIGDKTPDGNGYYVMTANNESIYTAGSYTTEPLLSSRLALTNKNLYKRDDTLPTDITAIRFNRDGALLADAVLGEDGMWDLVEPEKLPADSASFTAMQMAFAGLTVTEHVAWSTDDLAQYGLDKPKDEFEYTVAGKQQRLLIGGRRPEDNFMYCMMAGGETVFTVNPELFTFLDKPFIELIDRFVFLPSIYDTTYMTIKIDGRTDVMEFDVPAPKDNPDNDKPETFILNGEKLEGKDSISGIKRYYQGAIGIRADKVDFEANPAYEPERSVLTILYKLRNGDIDEMLVELIPTADGYGYYGFKNGEYSGFVISRTQMDEQSMGIRQGYVEMNEKIAKDKAK